MQKEEDKEVIVIGIVTGEAKEIMRIMSAKSKR